MTQTASVTLYMKMWPVDDLNNATKLAETSAKISLYLKIQFLISINLFIHLLRYLLKFHRCNKCRCKIGIF